MSTPPRTADDLRRAWVDFFAARGHSVVPSASVVPVDPSLLFTVAGMVPFKAYFTGDERPPWSRAVSIQKCVRAGGKHNDLDDIGRTNRHFSFFEMLGNFSFGDYFKAEAIPWAWELVTEVLGLDPGRIWITVHVSDDEAEKIWRDVVGVPAERIQRLDEDNFWRMGETGPCGPCSELFYDLGEDLGPGGGPAAGGEDRYVEFWNLVFMQYDQRPDGSMVELPKPSIDTGAGLERLLAILQGRTSIWDIDVFRPLIETASHVTGARYGADAEDDVSLRIIAEHSRTATFVVGDGVVPSNEERGYVLRRIIRRAVRHAYRLGARDPVMPEMVERVVEVMGGAYPELVENRERVVRTVGREEERFRATLERGLALLDELLARGDVGGDDAFFLHDTLGFPIDLTREIVQERGRDVDVAGFEARMREQRERARAAHEAAGGGEAGLDVYRAVLERRGPTEFIGREEYTSTARVVALVRGGKRVAEAAEGEEVEVVLDRTPFYAESGGQVGDTGEITSGAGVRVEVLDARYGLPGTVIVHRGRVVAGVLHEGDPVTAAIDGERRDDIRRNHTATHLLHWALREVLGTEVAQAGSLVAPDRLRFDFSYHEAVTREQLDRVEDLANAEVLTDAPVRHYETTREEALAKGALAFFGEKYGERVRVLEAGAHSIELCGGTHVDSLGFIGLIKIVDESAVGANLRRIEAVTGRHALAHVRRVEQSLRRAASILEVGPEEVPTRVERLARRVRDLEREVRALTDRLAAGEASELVRAADGDRLVVARRDGRSTDALRRLAQATLREMGSGVVALVGADPEGVKAGLAVAVSEDLQRRGVSAADLALPAARALGGGTARRPDLVVGGGPKVEAVEEALRLLDEQARAALG